MVFPSVQGPAPGARPQDFVQTTPGSLSPPAAALVAGSLYVARVWPQRDFIATKIAWYNGGTIGSSAEAGVMTYDGTTWTRVGTTGVVAQSGTTAKQVVTGLSIPISRSLITYLWLIPNNATGFFGRQVAGEASINDLSAEGILAGVKASVSQPCPSTVTGIAADIRTIWLAASA